MDATAWTVCAPRCAPRAPRHTTSASRSTPRARTCASRSTPKGQDLREQISQLRERMAHLEGLLEGLREAITKRVA